MKETLMSRSRSFPVCATITSWTWRALYVTLLLVCVLGVANATAPTAHANHPIGWWGGNYGAAPANWHQTNMHSVNALESVCIINTSTHVSDASFRSVLREKLYQYNGDGQLNPPNWDGLAGNKVNITIPLFNGALVECDELSQAQRNTMAIEAYHTHDVTTEKDGFNSASPCSRFAGNSACTENTYRVWNATARHYDMAWSYIWFPEASLYNTSTHAYVAHPEWVIHHEFGHVLGLNDGTGDQCYSSIMHAGKGGCPITASTWWPTQADRNTVTYLANKVD
jgi:hypothetical protein